MNTNNGYTQAQINKHYEKNLIALLERLSDAFDKQNEKFKTKHGFLLMMVRDPSEGNVDIATNFPDDYMVSILESALQTAKKGNKKQTLTP